ncbi:hypothetical protein AB205_0055690 [Aquarana catesbeiana]|uniref:Uncharacterized protein n=1 Tax=Aquarana catesbeiana TaxID=8400 RepID=A0A2G9S9S6_AQUCT|nr:hypothetical protein AB205_0055690 [Aquarana catesbeiana]
MLNFVSSLMFWYVFQNTVVNLNIVNKVYFCKNMPLITLKQNKYFYPKKFYLKKKNKKFKKMHLSMCTQ